MYIIYMDNKRIEFPDKKTAENFFMEASLNSEGSEREKMLDVYDHISNSVATSGVKIHPALTINELYRFVDGCLVKVVLT